MAYETTIAEQRAVRRRHGGVPRPGASQAFSFLYFAYIVVPVTAGVDKYFHYLVDWNIYVSPAYASLVGGNVPRLMDGVGVAEILAGVIVALRPRLGGWIVAAWLWGIIINLLLIPGYFDIALRDFGLSLGALAMASLAKEVEP